jgi:hypothetical protein
MSPRQVDPDQPPAFSRSGPLRDRHAHHASLSRRRFLGGAAGAVGVTLGASVLDPTRAFAGKPTNPTPRPIPGGFDIGGQVFHVFGFGPGQEPSTITDFNGFTGVTDVQGTGTATYPDGSSETLLFDTDMRFMDGAYVGVDGAVHKGTFGFV